MKRQKAHLHRQAR